MYHEKELKDICQWCGIYNGVIFSTTMCVSGYDQMKRAMNPLVTVETDMKRS